MLLIGSIPGSALEYMVNMVLPGKYLLKGLLVLIAVLGFLLIVG